MEELVKQSLVGSENLNQFFPEALDPETSRRLFQSFVTTCERFAVLVVQIDDFDGILKQLGETIASEIVMRLMRITHGLSKTKPIKPVQLSQARFACFCEDMNEDAAVLLAREIQRRLALVGKETVSAGIAVYPFRLFDKPAILDNALKALDHAGFFGPNTVTPFDAVSLNISADKLYQDGDIDGAIREFEKGLMVDPENVNLQNSLGVCFGVKGKLEAAIDAFERAICLDPKDLMPVYNLGLAHLKRGDRETALRWFLEAHKIDGDIPEVAYQIGMCYREAGQIDGAIEYLEKAVSKKVRGAYLFRALGDCYLEKKMLRKAVKAYEKAIKENPTDAKTLSTLGYLYGALDENLEIAIVLCRESITLDADNALYRVRLGRLYLQKGDCQKALEQFKLAAELGQDSAELILEAQGARPAEREIRNSQSEIRNNDRKKI
ncbi:MAG: DUF2225 domain-containing protein [Deltaproteobacteria bacterium]|nr:DUF2225 domain-containing protein [Deltaproteobacteria bacterium]